MKKLVFLLFVFAGSTKAADSVDVTFRYNIVGFPSGLSVPGEFNGWSNTAWPMSYMGGTLWIRNARLAVGGNPGGGLPGAWQYKFYYTGAAPWPNDPLNHHVNAADNNNSFIYVKDPTIYQFIPNQRAPVVPTASPIISAYIFPKVGSVVDTASLQIIIDGTTYAGLGAYYNFSTKQLSYTPPPVPNGSHTVILRAGTNADTVTFVTQGGFVRILNRFPFSTWKSSWTLNGLLDDTSVTSVKLVRNSTDTFTVFSSRGSFTYPMPLVDGANTIVALADSAGAQKTSSPILITRKVNHAPSALISISQAGGNITLDATQSSDPDSGQGAALTYLWSTDPSNPEAIPGVDGSSLSSFSIIKPTIPGEYYLGLIATDPDGNRDTTRNYFTLLSNDTVAVPTLANNPSWVKQGRMYQLFFKSATPQGTINAALPRLDYIASMGYNIIWVMPVMKNAYTINNGPGPGYDIVDFYTVAPEYGTNDDFKRFVARAHQLGLKIILDVTPNHTSKNHPFVADVLTFRQNSQYWGYYQHQKITNPNYHPELIEASTADSVFVFYAAFSDEILNYNWSDLDARNYMIDVYKWWVRAMGIDGYRLDVYWGPTRRANNGNGGENEFGLPLRTALKHFKPDIFLLAEDHATGIGTETKFGDRGGGVDAAYDWALYQGGVFSFYNPGPQSSSLNNYLLNFGGSSMGFVPGPNAYFMRFLENHDEERIAYRYGNVTKTKPVATAVLLSVGMPDVYSGEEVGWGTGISDYDQRRRGVIDWNNQGGSELQPHYQKLAQIRKQFAPFWSQEQIQLATGTGLALCYTRPLNDLNGIFLTNFDSSAQCVMVNLRGAASPNVYFTNGVQNGRTYYASDLYNDTVYAVVFNSGTAQIPILVRPYGSSVLVLAETTHTLTLPTILGVTDPATGIPSQFSLSQNYPNPFNPTTSIEYSISKPGFASLKIFNLLGQEVATLAEGFSRPGHYVVSWDAGHAPSGVYLYRLSTPAFQSVKKMLLVR
ncbi:MAG TPA: alpha-amylase family glycosyl hydrolase [Bacteroidota bacterium]|nr:alpha-amylase family glycosyl hydrolase [Bacteroidota bacterium]